MIKPGSTKKYNVLTLGSILFAFTLVAVLSVGFSGWVINPGANVDLDVDVGNVREGTQDFGNNAYYKKGTQKGFSYYTVDDDYHFTSTSVSIQFFIKPEAIQKALNEETRISFSLSYQARTTLDILLFKKEGGVSEPASSLRFEYTKNPDSRFFSDTFNYSETEIENGKSEYKISAEATLFSDDNPSLSTYFADSDKTGNGIVLDVIFDFTILDVNSFASSLNNIKSMTISTSVEGK